MTWTVRRLRSDDAEAARTLNREAFGFPVGAEPEAASVEQPGKQWFGAFDDDGGELVATTVDREFEAWFGGRVLPLAGIANVTVAAEHRSRGVLTPLLTEVLDRARERGAVLSTLFPSAPGIYRRFGFEAVTNACQVDVPSTSLAAVPAAAGVTLRRAGPEDAQTIGRIYDTWAAGQNGPLTRRGVSFPAGDQGTLDAFSGVSLVLDGAGDARGYAAWTRGPADGSGPTIEVADLVALDVTAYRSLLRTVGSFGSVTATVRLRASGVEPLRLLLPSLDWTVVSEELCMLKVLDVPGAITGHRCAPGLDLRLGFTLTADVLPELNGGYRVEASGGALVSERGEVDDDRILNPRGLALLYAGAASCADLRALGLLTGGDQRQDADWDALFGGWPNRVRDTF